MQPSDSGRKPNRNESAALDEALEVLRLVASVRACDRALAVRYTEARSALLAGRLGSFVPPYFVQCVSVFKFQDFITLYAPDAARRIAFIDETFEGCRRALGFARRPGAPEEDPD